MKALNERKHFLALLPIGFALVVSRSNNRVTWVAISILVAVILYKFVSYISKRIANHKIFDKGNLPSVGDKNPITGNISQIFQSGNCIKTIKQYHDKLGKTYGIFFGPDPWVLTMEDEVLQKIFIDDSNKHIDVNQFRIPVITEINRSLTQLRGDEWRQVRKTLNPTFSHKQMKTDNVYKDIEDACNKFILFIQSHPIDKSRRGRTVDIFYSAERFTAEVVFKVAYGSENKINFTPGERDKLIDSFDAALANLQGPFVTLCVLFDTARQFLGHFVQYTAFSRNLRYILTELNNSVEERRAKRNEINTKSLPGDQRKMIDSMIDAVDNKQIDIDTLRANLYFLFSAGFETTANTVSLLCWYLAKYPDIQDKLRQAINVAGESATYLQYCMYEILRLYPAVPAAGRILTEDMTTSKGQTIFKGTAVSACVYSIHHSEEYWGPDAEDFRPERFEGGPLHPLHWFGFGKGPRSCLGKNLATAEIKAIITRLLLKYRIESCETTPSEINWSVPNMIHILIKGPINLRFVELDGSKRNVAQ